MVNAVNKKEIKEYAKDIVANGRRIYANQLESHSRGIKGLNRNYSDDFLAWYQTRGVDTLLEKKRILIADEMGVGKTAQAVAGKLEIENKNHYKVKALVVVPNTIKEQWAERIGEYCKRKQEVAVLYGYLEKDLNKTKKPDFVSVKYSEKDFSKKIEKADFVIVNYEVFGTNGTGKRLTKKLLESGFNYVILDEAHNVKNDNAYSSSNIQKLAKPAEYLCLISGTPIPNKLKDSHVALSMLEPENYKTAEVVRRYHGRHPEKVGALIKTHLLRRTLEEVSDLPPITSNDESGKGVLELSGDQKRVYTAIYENDLIDGATKLQELTKALIDPSLVNPKFIYDEKLRSRLGEIESVKYKKLDSIVERSIKKGDKIVIFSSRYRNGITDKLEERYKQHGVVRIDGTVSQPKREGLLKDFKNNPNKRIFIGTTATVGEGIDGSLDAANHAIFIDEPYTFDEKKQAISRVYRPGQKKPVKVWSLAVKDTLDIGILGLQKMKDKAETLMLEGIELDKEHIRLLNDIKKYSTYSPLSDWITNNDQKKAMIYGQIEGLNGSENVKKNKEKLEARLIKLVTKEWDRSYQANTARVYKQIIESLSETENLDRIVDLGSGRGVVSHALNKPTTNVEILGKLFERSKRFAHPKCRNIEASFHDLKDELADESFDLAVMSLSLNEVGHSEMKIKNGERTEQEEAVREANRILRKDGYLIVTLPPSRADAVTALKIHSGLSKIGFENMPELTGLVESGNGKSDFRVYNAVYKKVDKPSKENVSDKLLMPNKKYSHGTGRKAVAGDFKFVQNASGGETINERLSGLLQKTTKQKLLSIK